MIVRSFKEEDRETFLKLCCDFYNSNATLRTFNGNVANKTFDMVLAKHENLWGYLMFDKECLAPIGYSLITSYWCNEEGGNILVLDELFIVENGRHKGYASLFMEWLEQSFKDRAVAITLEVLTTNVNACNLYQKEGFKPDGFTTYTKELK